MGGLRFLAAGLFLALLASSQVWPSHGGEEAVREGRTEPASPYSYVKGWSDWAQAKMGAYGKKDGQTLQPGPAEGAAPGWSDWAYQKISSFSGRAPQDAEAGKEKLKSGAKAGQEKLEEAKAGAKHGSEIGSEYVDSAYESGKDVGSQATEKLKQEVEL